MKSCDVIVIGSGIMGVSVALELRNHFSRVLIMERGEPGREASYDAAGMLAALDRELPQCLRAMARTSAAMYRTFIDAIEAHSGIRTELSNGGTIELGDPPPDAEWNKETGLSAQKNKLTAREAALPAKVFPEKSLNEDAELLAPAQLKGLVPDLVSEGRSARLLDEAWLDPRQLMTAALQAARNRKIEIRTHTAVQAIKQDDAGGISVTTSSLTFQAGMVVNCAGAWAGSVEGVPVPTLPVKGQMLALEPLPALKLGHVVRAPEVYVVPRCDGRFTVGSTVERVGFNKEVEPESIRRMHQAAARILPPLAGARVLESWAGLRPGTPDDLPVLGRTSVPNYFLATGHFRNGILLAPITALLVSQLARGLDTEYDLSPFSVERFCTRRRPGASELNS